LRALTASPGNSPCWRRPVRSFFSRWRGFPSPAGFSLKIFFFCRWELSARISCRWFLRGLLPAVASSFIFRVFLGCFFKGGDGTTEVDPGAGFKGLLVALAVIVLILGVFPQTLLGPLVRLPYTW